MQGQQLRAIWQDGGPAVGIFTRIPSSSVTEICGRAGLDFVIIDMEHGPLTIAHAEEMVRGALVGGSVPIIRVPQLDPVLIQQALDTGCAGVQVPQVASGADARRVVESAKYWPGGKRGVCRFVRASGYSAMDRRDYFRLSNEQTLIVVMVEGAEGLKNIEDIIKIPGLDVVFIGPYDLSQSLGLTGQVSHPQVEEAMRKAIDAIRKAGLIAGTFVDTREAAQKWLAAGIQYLAYGIDTGILFQACRESKEGMGTT